MTTVTPTTNQPKSDHLTRCLSLICALIILLMPFHAFLTVWTASIFGHYAGFRLWKEFLLLPVGIGAIVMLVRQSGTFGNWRVSLRESPLRLVTVLYVAVCIVSGLIAYAVGGVTDKALLLGLVLDLRFLVFFGLVWLLANRDGGWIHAHWRALLLVPALVVMVFGILQFTVLPADFLKHFGYGPGTIEAVQTIDQKAAYQRIQSTLRGANPLGTYLVLIIAAFGGLIMQKRQQRVWYAVGLSAACIVLGMTFSRSAWIGAVMALGWLLYQALRASRWQRYLLIAAVAGLVVCAGVGLALRHNDVFQNTFFHTDEHSRSAQSSNTGHLTAIRSGLHDIVRQPFGSGIGTAGPASVYNNKPARIAENYFVQIGQETGVLGLGLFLAINIYMGRELWRRRESALARILLASLLGISCVNLLSHAWTDDTIAYVWWGLAGAALAIKSKRNTKEEPVL